MDAPQLTAISPHALGQRLQAARKRCGLTQEEAASAIGVARTTAFAQPIAIAQFVVEREVTTPELVKQWAEHAHIDRLLLRSVLTDIETKARFRPGRPHPLYAWWQASVW